MYDLTMITAVNNKYLEKFKSNYPLWVRIDEFKQLPFMIFVHKDCFTEVNKFIKQKRFSKINVSTRLWGFDKAESVREEMLSAFVFGVAEHVHTFRWAKIDCDVTPKEGTEFTFPDITWERDTTMLAKGWGYTKVKGEPNWEAKGHWLNRLDDWADSLPDFEGTKRMFPENITTAKYKHPRICSFFSIEKTCFTQHLSDMCFRTGGRLPVPSHDTTVFYTISRLGNGRKVKHFNFKHFFTP